MPRSLYPPIAAACYAVFFATFLYLIGFVADLAFLPRTVDRGPEAPVALAIVLDVALIALFAAQHSVMARPAFKRAWTRVVAPPLERSVYVLAASAALIVLFVGWRPVAGTVWAVEGPAALLLWAGFLAGWGIVLLSTFLINHFELFGLQQAWLGWRQRAAAAPRFRTPFLYRFVRHPLYSGFFLAFWSTPQMSAGHLVLALGMSAYILIAIRYEERDLTDTFGEEYRAYTGRVGMLVPGVGRRR
jgi:protein-S-isoprenylcysteine O-methyltransferase Ste14